MTVGQLIPRDEQNHQTRVFKLHFEYRGLKQINYDNVTRLRASVSRFGYTFVAPTGEFRAAGGYRTEPELLP